LSIDLTEPSAKRVGTNAVASWHAIVRGMRHVAASDAYRAFLERDPQRALRVVASKEGAVQRRSIAMDEELLREEVRRDTLRLPVDPHTMVYALVRTVDSFLYADPIAGEKPDMKKAVEILKLMLR
jgi:Tetracyclin repressor-like, C-terminal domain